MAFNSKPPTEDRRAEDEVTDQPAREARQFKIPWRQSLAVAVAAGIGYGFDAYAVNIYSIVLPSIRAEVGMSVRVAGLIGTIFLIGYTIGTVGFGIAADRFGRRDTLGVSILVYGLTTMLGGIFTKSVAVFTLLRFLTGVGGAGELAVGAPYTAEMFPRKVRALGTGGIMFSLYSLGYILAAGAALVIVPRWGWQPAFIFAIAPAVIIFIARRWIKESVRFTTAKLEQQAEAKQQAVKAKQEKAGRRLRVLRTKDAKRRIGIGWMIYTANAVGYWGMTVFLTTFMVEKFGVSPGTAILYALLMYIVQFFFCYLGTGLADLYGRRFSCILGALIMMTCTAVGALAGTLALYLAFETIAIAMLGWLWGVGDTYISELFPTEVRGTGFGICVGGGRLASVVAPFAVSAGIAASGVTWPYFGFTFLWILTIVGYLLGPETAKQELEDKLDTGTGREAGA